MSNSEIIRHLLHSLTKDDEGAFRKLYDLFFPKIARFAGYYLQSEIHIEETISEVFLELWKQRKNLKSVTNIDGYLYTVTKNKSIRIISQGKNKNITSLDLLNEEFMTSAPGPEEIQLNKELNGLISKAINELPPRCKEVFLLAREENLKYREIANILSISEKTVNAQMVTAIKKLTEKLRNYLSE